jgi:DNA (cytosine-5)-methyltransferase 1
MRSVHSSSTEPELILQKMLKKRGIKFKSNELKLPGKPDIIIKNKKLAVFVDGDFWHGGQWFRRRKKTLSEQFNHSKNKEYWLNKIKKNIDRDFSVTSDLIESGWSVLRFWESKIKENPEECANLISTASVREDTPQYTFSLPDRSFAEFFAGIGLVRMGLEKKGWKIVFANDINKSKYDMYSEHFGDSSNYYKVADVHSLSPNEIPVCTLATASFPCTDLSLAGAREGIFGKQSSAVWGFLKLLKEMGARRPPIVLLENVVGLLTSKNGADFELMLRTLNELGYGLDTFIIDAVHFVPQSRKRLFVVASNHMQPSDSRHPLLFTENDDIRPNQLINFIISHQDLNWQIRSLPPLPQSNCRFESILEDIPTIDPIWWNEKRSRYLLHQMSPRHREQAEKMISGRNYTYGTVFRRIRQGRSMAELRTDGIAGCLRTPKGGSARQILFVAGNGHFKVRLLTARECARLMGANDLAINVPLNQALFGLGDAVCVPVIEWIAEHYLNPLVTELIRGIPLTKAIAMG